MRTRYALIFTVTLVGITGCQERPLVEPLEEAVIEAMEPGAVEASSDGLPAAAGASTVCTTFSRQLTELRARLAEDPADAALQRSAALLSGIVNNTCD